MNTGKGAASSPADAADLVKRFIDRVEAWLTRDDRIIPILMLDWPDDHPQIILRKQDKRRQEQGRAEVLRDGQELAEALDRFDTDIRMLLKLLNHAEASNGAAAKKLWPDLKVSLQQSAIRLQRSGPDLVEQEPESVGTEPKNPQPKKKPLPPSRILARAAYEWGMDKIKGAEHKTITELFDAIREQLDFEAEKAQGKQSEQLETLLNALPSNAETFGKYLRDAGIKRYDSQGGRLPAGSVRRPDQV